MHYYVNMLYKKLVIRIGQNIKNQCYGRGFSNLKVDE